MSVPAVSANLKPRTSRRGGRTWYRFWRNPAAVIGLVLIVLVVACAAFAPLIAPYPEHAGYFVNFQERHLPPSAAHLFGTDNTGRDILSRIIFGYRISLFMVVFVLGLSVPFGVLLGLLAGYYGGWVEILIMRVTDIFLAIPALVMALAITAALTPNLLNGMIAITLLWWNWHTRLIYTYVKSLRHEAYIEASQLAGASDFHIIFREILPNCISIITVKTTLDAGFVILIASGLSFLGLGAQPPTPDLGTMVSAGANYLPDYWWESIIPGLAILVAILGFNLFGDGLRDLLDVELT